MNQLNAEHYIQGLLVALGEDPVREGLRDTPRRMAAMLRELCTREEFAFTTFNAEGMSEMVVQSPIPFHSLCEHHCLPFVGEASVCYIPGDRIVGLSKLARAVHYCSRGLQNQERITTAVAEMLQERLQPQGVGVVIRARHFCMEMRGVKAHDTWTTTSCMKGALFTKPEARAEFLSFIRK
jgi:GTP cyclohydrolase IA